MSYDGLRVFRPMSIRRLAPGNRWVARLPVRPRRRRRFRQRRFGGFGRWSKRAVNKAKLKSVELKTHDVNSYTEDEMDSGTTFQCLNYIAQGDTDQTREGIKITPRRLEFRAQVNNGSGQTLPKAFRIVIFMDKGQAGNTPSFSGATEGLFEDTIGSGGINMPFNRLNRRRFKILFDHRDIVGGTSNEDVDDVKLIKFNYNFKPNNVINYLGTTAVEASMGKGSLFLMYYSEVAGGSNIAPVIRYHSRLRYYG